MKIATKKWNTHDVGTKVEVFAIAGCDPISKYIQLFSHDLFRILLNRPFNDIKEES